jgi:dihydroorotate dehydrogenase electron transfer subunit
MKQELVPIISLENLTPDVLELTFVSKSLSASARPGQFINIHVDANYPLLRRPFSIFTIDGEKVSIVFNVIGRGTKVLATKRPGDLIDIVGPCGNHFLSFAEGNYDTAVFVAGGIGIAPFPFLTKHFPPGKKIVTYLGARTKGMVITKGVRNASVATDDGSMGFHGTVLDLIKDDFSKNRYGKTRFFTCGPTRMMKALSEFAHSIGSDCYASLETDMACGIGLCQGCNIELIGADKKYALVCKEGTIFETKTVKL